MLQGLGWKQLPLRPKQPHLRSKFENTSQAGAESDAGPKQPSSLRGHAEAKQPDSHRPPEANVWLLQSPPLSFDAFGRFFCMWMGFVISLFAQTLVNPLWLKPCCQHPMACATKFPALGDDMKYGTASPISSPRQATWIEAICHCKSSSAAVVFNSHWPKLQTRNKNKPALISNTSSAASTRKIERAIKSHWKVKKMYEYVWILQREGPGKQTTYSVHVVDVTS